MRELEADPFPAVDGSHRRAPDGGANASASAGGEAAGTGLGPPGTAAAGLGRRVRSGAVWSAGTTVLMRFGNIAIMAVVARIVTREAFGVFGLAVTAHMMLVALAELGVSAAVARSD